MDGVLLLALPLKIGVVVEVVSFHLANAVLVARLAEIGLVVGVVGCCLALSFMVVDLVLGFNSKILT